MLCLLLSVCLSIIVIGTIEKYSISFFRRILNGWVNLLKKKFARVWGPLPGVCSTRGGSSMVIKVDFEICWDGCAAI